MGRDEYMRPGERVDWCQLGSEAGIAGILASSDVRRVSFNTIAWARCIGCTACSAALVASRRRAPRSTRRPRSRRTSLASPSKLPHSPGCGDVPRPSLCLIPPPPSLAPWISPYSPANLPLALPRPLHLALPPHHPSHLSPSSPPSTLTAPPPHGSLDRLTSPMGMFPRLKLRSHERDGHVGSVVRVRLPSSSVLYRPIRSSVRRSPRVKRSAT